MVIVLGIYLIINGFTKIYNAELYSNEFRYIDKIFTKYGSNKFMDIDFKGYQNLMERVRFHGAAGIFFGAFCAIVGTLLLREEDNQFSVRGDHEIKIEEDDLEYKNRKWRL